MTDTVFDSCYSTLFFFFQAEDGIRDYKVTGVQTCALPICMAVILFSGGLIAWAGARFFQDSRRQQDLELLLTTPQGSRHILGGQWCVLRRALTWPLGVVLVLALPTGISLLYDYVNDYQREYWSMLQPFLIAMNLTLEAVALCWVGIRFGL